MGDARCVHLCVHWVPQPAAYVCGSRSDCVASQSLSFPICKWEETPPPAPAEGRGVPESRHWGTHHHHSRGHWLCPLGLLEAVSGAPRTWPPAALLKATRASGDPRTSSPTHDFRPELGPLQPPAPPWEALASSGSLTNLIPGRSGAVLKQRQRPPHSGAGITQVLKLSPRKTSFMLIKVYDQYQLPTSHTAGSARSACPAPHTLACLWAGTGLGMGTRHQASPGSPEAGEEASMPTVRAGRCLPEHSGAR